MDPTSEFANLSQPLLLERYYAKWEFGVRLNLSASDPEPLAMSELLRLADAAARTLWDDLALGYVEPEGSPLVRAEIAAHYGDVDPSDVILTTGAQEAIYLTCRALIAPGDHAVVIAPAYQLLHEAVRAAGGVVSLVMLDGAAGWVLDIDEVVGALRKDTALLVLNFPHNPTGSLPSASEFRRLIDECESRGIRVVSDEVFRGIERRAEDRLPAAVDAGARAVSIGDLSKSYGLAGLRVGWVASRDHGVLERIAGRRDYTTICGSGPSQVLALIALRARDQLQERARAIVARNLTLAQSLFDDHADRVEWLRPAAGTTAFPRLRHGNVEAFCDRLRRESGVLLAPGSLFGVDTNHFRLGLGQSQLERGLPALRAALAQI